MTTTSGPAVIAKITAQSGKRGELVDHLRAMLEHVESEAGTIEYKLHLDRGDENVVWFYERYESDDALNAHGTSEAMKAVGLALRDIAAARPEIIVLDVVGGKGF